MHRENTRQESDLQEPLCGSEVDCRGLDFMPLAVAQLRDSDLVATSSGDGFKAAVLLWAKSWWEVPAGSLLNNDKALARGAGLTEREFLRIKSEALHGWIPCSDGRLYHPLIVDFAERAAKKRRDQSERANSRWAKEKAKTAGKSAEAKSPRTSAGNAVAYAAAMQGRGRDKGESENPSESESQPPRVVVDNSRKYNFDTYLDTDGDSLTTSFFAEARGEKRQPQNRHLRPRDCWFMAVGVLVVIDRLEESAARKIVAQLFRGPCGEDPENLARAALATYQKFNSPGGLRRAQAFFAACCNGHNSDLRLSN